MWIGKPPHEAKIELANNTYINGSVYVYALDELEIESVNSTKLGGMENLMLSAGEIELHLANNAEQAVGTIAWVG
ncbi:MAG: hypothetical protein Q9N34_08260 [Aquificota bacterium]|nr:hypothetical protein [Aquificota bacterium]